MAHPCIFSPSDIKKQLEVSASTSDELFSHCPFCDFTTQADEKCKGQPMNMNDERSDIRIDQRTIKRHILDHLLTLFQLALPPRSDVEDILSVESASKGAAQSNRELQDEELDLTAEHYMDPEYSSPLSDQEANIPEASDQDDSLTYPEQHTRQARDPLLEVFVRNAMSIPNRTFNQSIGSVATAAMSVLLDLIEFIFEGLVDLKDLGSQEEVLSKELRELLRTLATLQDEGISEETSIACLAPAGASKPTSLFAFLHELLWNLAYRLELISCKDRSKRSNEVEDLESAIQGIRDSVVSIEKLFTKTNEPFRMADLESKIKLNQSLASVKLNLTYPGRELIYRGDLSILSTEGQDTWQVIHAILLDNYLVLAEASFSSHEAENPIDVTYNVSISPIPIDLLNLQKFEDSPINGTRFTPERQETLWPFKIKHLGRNRVYTLASSTLEACEDWCSKIVEIQTWHAGSLKEQKAEPFMLQVIADADFGTDLMRPSGLSEIHGSSLIKSTPLYCAMQNVEDGYRQGVSRNTPVCRAAPNCAATFIMPNRDAPWILIGTFYGIYVSQNDEKRIWRRVTQLAVLEEFQLLLFISDRSFHACPLDTVGDANALVCKTPQKLSGNHDAKLFALGHMQSRTLVFYVKSVGSTSTFKVLEPVYLDPTVAPRNKFGAKRRSRELFRDYDDFYIPSETYALNIFRSSIAVSTERDIQILALDRKLPFPIPDLKAPEVATIAERIQELRPLGMFRLNEAEFLLVYTEAAVYVNKHGDVSRTAILEFIGKVRQACLVNSKYLVLIDDDGAYVEIRNAMNGRLKQVISGENIKMIYDGAYESWHRPIITMQHPYTRTASLVLEMVIDPDCIDDGPERQQRP
ncbi:Rho guanine nucleotide exchange factor [Lecanora helva]